MKIEKLLDQVSTNINSGAVTTTRSKYTCRMNRCKSDLNLDIKDNLFDRSNTNP